MAQATTTHPAIPQAQPVTDPQEAGSATFQRQEGVVFTITLSADGAKVEGLELNARF